jgi:DNA-binding NarL/FixJ family response regulator
MGTGWEVAMRRLESFAIVLVGKSILLREGLSRILRSANFRIPASVSRAEDVPQCKPKLHRPLFLIVHTGEDFSVAIEQIEILRDRHPDCPIAIVADHYRLEELVSAFRAGAKGYFVDVMTCDVFIRSIELVIMGETVIPPTFLSLVLDPHDPHGDHLGETVLRDEKDEAILVTTEDAVAPQLSPREKSILRCLTEGDSNKSIARKIDIAEATVKVHVKAILRKIRVQNRTQAAIWGVNNELLARTANNELPLLTSDVNERLPNPVAKIHEIRQVDAPVPLSVINHDAIQLEVPRSDRLIRGLKTEAASGSANSRRVSVLSSHRSK